MSGWKRCLASFGIGLTILGATATVLADVPRLMPYQGRVAGMANETVSIRVRLYDAATNGNVLFDQTQNATLSGGVFNLMLGGAAGIPDTVWDAAQVWAGVSVNAAAELSPRARIGMVPYAAKVRSSEMLVIPNTSSPRVSVDANGNVGVGTTTPVAPLHLFGSSDAILQSQIVGTDLRISHTESPILPQGIAQARLNLLAVRSFVAGSDNATFQLLASNPPNSDPLGILNAVESDMKLSMQLQGSEKMRIDNVGIGIGTNLPECNLHVFRGSAGAVTANANSIAAFENNTSGYLNILTPDNTERGILFGEPSFSAAGGIIYNAGGTTDAMQFRTNGNVTRMMLDANGNLALGNHTPTHRLDVDGAARLRGNTATNLLVQGSNDDIVMDLVKNSSTTPSARIQFNGYTSQSTHQASIQFFTRGATDSNVVERARIGEDGRLDVFGRTATCTLEITAGCDVSEQFDVAPASGAAAVEPEPGMVACIDPTRSGKLIVSSKPYDRTVAGILSGAGGVNVGMLLTQAGELTQGEHPVALTGRVWTYCDASLGAIQPGDLLTTSSTAGHAMKVADHTAAQGAIIGKAMTGLDDGRGLVLVLVNLQ